VMYHAPAYWPTDRFPPSSSPKQPRGSPLGRDRTRRTSLPALARKNRPYNMFPVKSNQPDLEPIDQS